MSNSRDLSTVKPGDRVTRWGSIYDPDAKTSRRIALAVHVVARTTDVSLWLADDPRADAWSRAKGEPRARHGMVMSERTPGRLETWAPGDEHIVEIDALRAAAIKARETAAEEAGRAHEKAKQAQIARDAACAFEARAEAARADAARLDAEADALAAQPAPLVPAPAMAVAAARVAPKRTGPVAPPEQEQIRGVRP